ncbi:MAG: hypothetical protein J0L93_03775 [Deltaproteobacteria bacterium]|nr:hypothetical protein [Deltaproteobacteria bacterium]
MLFFISTSSLLLPLQAQQRGTINQSQTSGESVYSDNFIEEDCMDLAGAGSTIGLVSVFKNGAYYDATPTVQCIYNLGIYNAQGQRIGTNYDSSMNLYGLSGKYLKTGSAWLNPPPGARSFGTTNNNFQMDYTGATSGLPLTTSLLYSSEAHHYYYIDKYRRTLLTDSFIDSLNLSANAARNIKYLQYNPDLVGIQYSGKPRFFAAESETVAGIELYFPENFAYSYARSRTGSPYSSMTPISNSFDPEAIVGDYAGIASSWILGSNQPYPGAEGYGQFNSWINNVLSPLNDGISNFEGYAYSGRTEQFKYLSMTQRSWSGNQCGVNGWAPCDKGYRIDNVMMYDENDMSRTGIFPMWSSIPGNFPIGGYGFVGSNLASLYFSSLFYDLVSDAGLGLNKTRQLVFKMYSLIDNLSSFTMRDFGAKMIAAGRALWPDGNGQSLYEKDIADVLRSRGIPLYGEANFKDGLPAGLMPVTQAATVNYFGSGHPESQPSGYGAANYTINGYKEPGTDYNYMGYTFYKHSKYGPCDKLVLTNGTFNGGSYNEDGDFYWEGKGRELGNLTIFVPENASNPSKVLQWKRYRQRCLNETEDGFYAEDVRPFGFRVIKSIKNGFSFTASKIQNTNSNSAYNNYSLTIVDPSKSFAGAATYTWTFTNYLGQSFVRTGSQVVYAALKDQPFTIKIERKRGVKVDTLTLRERGNDLDRNNGNAFVKSFCPNNTSCKFQ